MSRVIVVSTGIGGLTTAAMLARAGEDVTVLEAHIYPGGCAGTFYYTVHLPDGEQVTRWTDTAHWQVERHRVFGATAETFWRWQEATAGVLWDAALRGVPWPPASAAELAALSGVGLRIRDRGRGKQYGSANPNDSPSARRAGTRQTGADGRADLPAGDRHLVVG